MICLKFAPLILVPKKQPHVVDDALHAQLDDDTLVASHIVDGVPGEAPFHVVVLGFAVKQCLLHIPNDDGGAQLGRRDVAVDD